MPARLLVAVLMALSIVPTAAVPVVAPDAGAVPLAPAGQSAGQGRGAAEGLRREGVEDDGDHQAREVDAQGARDLRAVLTESAGANEAGPGDGPAPNAHRGRRRGMYFVNPLTVTSAA